MFTIEAQPFARKVPITCFHLLPFANTHWEKKTWSFKKNGNVCFFCSHLSVFFGVVFAIFSRRTKHRKGMKGLFVKDFGNPLQSRMSYTKLDGLFQSRTVLSLRYNPNDSSNVYIIQSWESFLNDSSSLQSYQFVRNLAIKRHVFALLQRMSTWVTDSFVRNQTRALEWII